MTRSIEREALRRPVGLKDAARLLRVSPRELRRRIRRLEILTIRVRGRELVPPSEMLAALEPEAAR